MAAPMTPSLKPHHLTPATPPTNRNCHPPPPPHRSALNKMISYIGAKSVPPAPAASNGTAAAEASQAVAA